MARQDAPPSAAGTGKRKWRLRNEMSFDVRSRGEEGTFTGIGSHLGPAWSVGYGELSLMPSFQWAFVPYQIEKEGAAFDAGAVSWGLAIGYSRRISDDLWLSAELGPALEVVTVRFQSSSDTSVHDAGGQAWRPSVVGGVSLWLDLGVLKYLFAANVSVPLVHAHEDVRDGAGAKRELLVPPSVQPGFSLGIQF
jgi:hypothetical protein